MFKCPICGKETIKTRDRYKLSLNFYKNKIICTNCKNELEFSNIRKFNVFYCLVNYFIVFNVFDESSLKIKIILSLLIFLLYSITLIYIYPLKKYND